jgi:tartrate dehydratase beta subunit/fumarate hydratase class I family protein
VVGFAELGMEAIYEFDVKNMPVRPPSCHLAEKDQ